MCNLASIKIGFSTPEAVKYLADRGYPLSETALGYRRKQYPLDPAFRRVGGRYFYRPEDLDNFLRGGQ